MVDLSEIINQIQPKAEKFSQALAETFKYKFLSIMRGPGAGAILTAFVAAYDNLANIEEAEMGPRVRGKDPLSLKNVRNLFIQQVVSDLKQMRIEGDELVIELLKESDIGIGVDIPEGPPQSVDMLGFYIKGMVGEHAFITPEHLELKRPGTAAKRGRLNRGFLITRTEYIRDDWAGATGIKFEEVRHSISGQRPYRGFQEAVDNLDLSIYIKQAIEETEKTLAGTKV